MCGIGGIFSISKNKVPDITRRLEVISELLTHRGPDGNGLWLKQDQSGGFIHRRLAIIDLSNSGSQPMRAINDSVVTYNGEIYNFPELRRALHDRWEFLTNSDTECLLAAYERYGQSCLEKLRGMFAFAIWDETNQRLFCARDRFGIKPFFYTLVDDVFYFSSEAKALLPFLPEINTNDSALAEYLTFQYTIGEKTLFHGIHQLLPGHALTLENGQVKTWRYWDISYNIDFDHSHNFFHRRLRELVEESIALHGRSDVPVGGYISGGIDSSLVYTLSQNNSSTARMGFHGKFSDPPGYDESPFAEAAVKAAGGSLFSLAINAKDFQENIEKIIYHLDFPVAGPGAFPQYMISKLASEHVKVVLGGQGGDEIFGGYARYVIAYLEQSLKAAIDGYYRNGNYVVTIESIIPNLGLLREYKPLIKEFWREGLFDPMDERYFRLINRSNDMKEEIDWSALDMVRVFEAFSTIFNSSKNIKKEAYFDSMTHFDFKCLLPALLQVEDRMSMAHGLESRVPFLDHPLVEFAAQIPADIKFKGGNMKFLLKNVFSRELPPEILNRRDKMGFPVPLKEWLSRELNPFAMDVLGSMGNRHRPYINSQAVKKNLRAEAQFSRKTWGLLSLELWYQQFHDKASEWRGRIDKPSVSGL